MPIISSKAVVHNPAGLADDVQVGPFTIIGPDVTVGAGTIIHNAVTIVGRTRIGSKCQLFPGAVVGASPAGAPEPAGPCRIGDRNIIREHVLIEAGLSPTGDGTIVGDDNLLMVGCQVAHDARLDGEGIFANFTRIAASARIEPFVRTSGFTTISEYATVGAYAFTTGYAAVEIDAPPYCIVQGLPAIARSVNTENLRRCGFADESIAQIKEAFRAIFNGDSALPNPDRLAEAQERFRQEPVKTLVDFLLRTAASSAGRQRGPIGTLF